MLPEEYFTGGEDWIRKLRKKRLGEESRVDKIIGFLGISTYRETFYMFNGKEICKTEYVIEALVRLLNPREVVLFLTDVARENHLGKVKKIFEKLKVPLTIVDVDDPKTENEIWDFFLRIVETVHEGERIAIDITHAFRHFHMFSFLSALYLREIKNAVIAGIYYGHFVPGENMTPIFDLTPALSLADWLYSSREFVYYYRGEGLSATIREQHRYLYSKNRTPATIQRMGTLLERFAKNFRYGQTKQCLDRAHSICRMLPEFKKEISETFLPIEEILGRLERLCQVGYPSEKWEKEGLTKDLIMKIHKLACLQFEKGYLAVSLATLRENIVNTILLIASFYDEGVKLRWLEREVRESAERILGAFLKKESGMEYDEPQYFEVVYEYLEKKDLYGKFVEIWNRVREYRNMLAHSEMSEEGINPESVEYECRKFQVEVQGLLERVEPI